MTKTRSTKRALLASALALLVCVTMLVGSTFAWFTDSVTSANNKIVAGTLDVQLLMDTGAGYVDISDSTDPIFGNGSIAQNNNAETLWEPGKTQVAYLAIKNNGSLALKYKVALDVDNVSKNLYKAMEYAIVPDATFNTVTAWTEGNDVVEGLQTVSGDVSLGKGETHYFALAIHMKEDAGNEYQGGQVNFDLTVLATQDTVEADHFGTNYDALASYSYEASAVIKQGETAVEVQILDKQDTKVGSVVVPAAAIDGAGKVDVKITDSVYKPNITVAAGAEKTTFDVEVTGLNDNNTVPVKVSLRIAAGLDPATVKLYHYDQLIPSTYNPNTGYVTFESATFSPFTVVYDAESEYVPPVVDEDTETPVASVVASNEYVNVDLPWGSYGQWSPAAGLDSKLEAAYTFSCTETAADVAANSPYANWYCDFYVMLDKDLGENEIFLGGNYGIFGWVGFHNGDLTLPANTEIGLLESVTVNPWTYLDVVENVGEFICGVGDVNNALEGATFTVMLRLTNPDNAEDVINVATIKYTF